MHVTFPALMAVATLASRAAAVDVGLMVDQNCAGVAVFCTGVNPNTCCADGRDFWGAKLQYIPKEWNLELRAHRRDSSLCGPIVEIGESRGSVAMCRPSASKQVTGSGYSFRNWKREDEVAETVGADTNGPCQRPDLLRLGDGTEYNLTELSDEQYNEVLEVSIADGGVTNEVPEYMAKYRH
ncbi:uncharacterized protein B0I36DRAFT_392399 [Microdochium trichocladiopsis]|uniref:Uncharacterized protein n=1 Tax=Microdochium trichocladiopsis TaxID=1682393 RepID=A0A9P8YGR6_9PEZI|nr:uncharacterized protein B0I36DRAFT_392399 [Microdochium trichocladiopsis]KAH7041417.1 hypothetical protein B0I36DRAFT_392399 [Microdochium trichocladiopsis]